MIAKKVGIGVQTETQSSEAGLYVFPMLAVGQYEKSAEKTGFKILNRTGLEIRIATRQEIDRGWRLQQSVEVTGEAPLLETTSAQRGQNLSALFLNKLRFLAGGIRNPRVLVQTCLM